MKQDELDCRLAQDLMSLSLDNKLGTESIEFLKSHCEKCKTCNELREELQNEITFPKTKETKVTKRKKKQFYFSHFVLYSIVYLIVLIAVTVILCYAATKGI